MSPSPPAKLSFPCGGQSERLIRVGQALCLSPSPSPTTKTTRLLTSSVGTVWDWAVRPGQGCLGNWRPCQWWDTRVSPGATLLHLSETHKMWPGSVGLLLLENADCQGSGLSRPSAAWKTGWHDEHLFLMHRELPFFMVDINWNLCLHVANPPGDGSYFTATAIWVTEKSNGSKVPLRNTSGGLSFIWGHRKRHIIDIPIPFHWESKGTECSEMLSLLLKSFLRSHVCTLRSECALCTRAQMAMEGRGARSLGAVVQGTSSGDLKNCTRS